MENFEKGEGNERKEERTAATLILSSNNINLLHTHYKNTFTPFVLLLHKHTESEGEVEGEHVENLRRKSKERRRKVRRNRTKIKKKRKRDKNNNAYIHIQIDQYNHIYRKEDKNDLEQQENFVYL